MARSWSRNGSNRTRVGTRKGGVHPERMHASHSPPNTSAADGCRWDPSHRSVGPTPVRGAAVTAMPIMLTRESIRKVSPNPATAADAQASTRSEVGPEARRRASRGFRFFELSWTRLPGRGDAAQNPGRSGRRLPAADSARAPSRPGSVCRASAGLAGPCACSGGGV
jgi:hypothetical protein